MPSYTFEHHSGLQAEFNDKRTYNSFIKNVEKMSKLTINHPADTEETVNVLNPHYLNNFEIVQKYDHVALKPLDPTLKGGSIELDVSFQYTWEPTLTGKYYNDGMFHFYPKKSNIKVNMSCEDIIDNLVMNGAKCSEK